MTQKRMLVGTRKGLLQFERRDGSWSYTGLDFEGVPIPYAVRDLRTDTIWVSCDHGHWGVKLHKSTDNGKSWVEVPAPKFPEGSLLKDDKPAVLERIWCIQPGGADQPERLYLGTHPGGLFRSDDGGDTFSLVQSLWDHPSRMEHWFGGGFDTAGICSILVDPRDSAHVTIAVSCGGVLETIDDGQTWRGRNQGLNAEFLPDPTSEFGQDPHCMTMCRDQPNVLWQQNHCGVYRSTNGGENWLEISEKDGPARFGWAIVADPSDPDTAWVLPATADERRTAPDGRLCVCKTVDGGKTWRVLDKGLPQPPAFDIVYRHGFDLGGDTLAFGSTTGNLFVSDDRGENWDCLGHHFPPIYSIRLSEF